MRLMWFNYCDPNYHVIDACTGSSVCFFSLRDPPRASTQFEHCRAVYVQTICHSPVGLHLISAIYPGNPWQDTL